MVTETLSRPAQDLYRRQQPAMTLDPRPTTSSAFGTGTLYFRFGKRTLDIVVGTALLLAALPVLLFVAIAIKCTSRGSVFFLQDRIGLDGRRFKMLKFRTMVENQEGCPETALARTQAEHGILLKIKEDTRVTSIGKFLRTFSLDELPQLANVVLGDMSLVGPRPAIPFMAIDLESAMRVRSRVRPGITGLWQIHARHATSLKIQLKHDEEYLRKLSLLLDLKILLLTIPAVLSGRGAK